ncbi:MAG: hypothetical protein AB1679_15005 [Actinomycetota bacterium]
MGIRRRWTTSAAASVLAVVTGFGAPATGATEENRCVDCRPAPLPCPPCFACIQTPPGPAVEALPMPGCPLPHH